MVTNKQTNVIKLLPEKSRRHHQHCHHQGGNHYVLRGGGLEKCCNLQNPMNTSRQLGQVEICSTLRDLICHILWPFYCHFMAFFGSKWPYWAIGSPSDPKWVEHWLNMVEHCTSHLGGWVWTPLAPKKWHFDNFDNWWIIGLFTFDFDINLTFSDGCQS